ncbi:cytochrome c oxidase subunit II [Roseateles violae]|uniref:cytochrome-c oxidase n=1 Tax=Roseateles violae TaxID=3058042 RepID=A0ABT8DT41_9BURK|nr:cytochrome c oxidase subunit II [Pelomonas sp. PFR6]MDN3921231.1 cytochrome c oxidase subunit II [Pelomonas sp. PFR6]
MVIAVVLIVIVLASLVFHFVNPWHPLALASNWDQMDNTLTITFVITGIFFVVLNLLLVYILVRFRRRAGQTAAHEPAAYQPVNHKLERWLTAITTVGIVALLAPGLLVYADYVRPPPEALEIEVLGTQWQWRFRFPGADGKLGRTDARFVKGGNPFGIDPGDLQGQDDTVVDGSEVHLPVGKPVRMVLRSLDVLHDFYVPPFRARMNMVPGLVTTYWFTPTKTGRYESMCAQLCGVGHANMRGLVVVDSPADYQAWLDGKPSFAKANLPPPEPAAGAGAEATATPAALGMALAKSKACVACHSIDGSAGVGPTWKGLYGKTEAFADGSKLKVDEAVLRQEIREPTSRVVQGFPPIMPKTELSDAEVDALIAYIRAQGTAP